MRAIVAVLASLAVACFANPIPSEYNGCNFEFTDKNGIHVDYNLSLFHLEATSPDFSVFDADSTRDILWLYKFNVCGSLSRVNFVNWEAHECVTQPGNGPCVKFKETNPKQCLEQRNVTGYIR